MILVIPPGSAKGERGPRAGDLFDTAFIDTVRALSPVRGEVILLVPWTVDLAPLVVAATLDLAPSFDPESRADTALLRRDIVPYVPPGHDAFDPEEDRFWLTSFVSLSDGGRRSFAQTLRDHAPSHVILLGAPSRPASFRRELRGRSVKILLFGSMLGVDEAAEFLGVRSDDVLDLEASRGAPIEADVELSFEVSSERSGEEELEPFIPFGLLLQAFFDEWLLDDPRAVGGEPV